MLIDGVVDSINSPETTNSPIPQAILHANAIVAYEFGNQWPTLGPYSRARPELAIRGWIISTTLTSNGPSRCYDIEPGGGHNGNIGAFMRQADTRWGKPILYTFASNVHDMIVAAANQGYGRGDYYIYAAHPDSHYGRHICGPGVCPYPLADATQYTFQTPENCDTGLFQAYVLPGNAPIPPLPNGDQNMAVTAIVNEAGHTEVFVEAEPSGAGHAGEVWNLWKEKKPDGSIGWNRDSNGNPDWQSLGTPK